MISVKAILLGLSISSLPVTLAQVAEWGQCGGLYYNGSTMCQSGLTCVFFNDWYSQCLRATTTSISSRTSTTSTSATMGPGSSTSTSSSPSTSATAKTWFSFGDSYTATGFSATGSQPSSGNPLGNPSFPGNTACGNGIINWVGYLANTYNTVLLSVYNHAVSGATIDSDIVQPFFGNIPSVSDQIDTFLNYEAQGKQYYNGWTSDTALFSVWIGINDIGNTYSDGGDRAAFNDILINRYFELMQSLYAAGARHFLFLSVPPVYRTPLMLQQSASARQTEKTVIDDYNAKLTARATAFANANSGVTTIVYDTTPLINMILDNPGAYGLMDATSSGSGNQVAWCDIYHISPPVHDEVAKAVAQLVAGTYLK